MCMAIQKSRQAWIIWQCMYYLILFDAVIFVAQPEELPALPRTRIGCSTTLTRTWLASFALFFAAQNMSCKKIPHTFSSFSSSVFPGPDAHAQCLPWTYTTFSFSQSSSHLTPSPKIPFSRLHDCCGVNRAGRKFFLSITNPSYGRP